MKKLIFLSAIALWLFAATGCEENENNANEPPKMATPQSIKNELSKYEQKLIKQKLIGTWEWVVSYGGVIGEKRPKSGRKREIIFTDNRVLITDNMDIVDDKPVITDKKKVLQDGSYIISKEQDKLYITTTPKEGAEDLEVYSGKVEISLDETGNILGFHASVGYYCAVYKKIN